VAEALGQGLSSVPGHAQIAMLIGGVVGILLAGAERFAPRQVKILLPSAAALGLAFVIPASISITMFFGAMVAAVPQRFALSFAQRFLIAIASGLIARESIAGIGGALTQLWG